MGDDGDIIIFVAGDDSSDKDGKECNNEFNDNSDEFSDDDDDDKDAVDEVLRNDDNDDNDNDFDVEEDGDSNRIRFLAIRSLVSSLISFLIWFDNV